MDAAERKYLQPCWKGKDFSLPRCDVSQSTRMRGRNAIRVAEKFPEWR